MQSDMYPLCPYHEAWKPDKPLDTRAGGAMPGPTLLAHVAARDGDAGANATTSAKTIRRFRTLPTVCLTRGRDQRYEEVAARCLLAGFPRGSQSFFELRVMETIVSRAHLEQELIALRAALTVYVLARSLSC
jgi:hypothetical protein